MIKNLSNLQARAEAFTDMHTVVMVAPPVTISFAVDVIDALKEAQKMQEAIKAILAECHTADVAGEFVPIDYIEEILKEFIDET